MSTILEKYLPQNAISLVSSWFVETKVHLTIKKPRQSKFGDFRPGINGNPHKISVNGDLNPYHFLITLTHEFAHVYTWLKFKNSVKPHGEEWKNTYTVLLHKLIDLNCFPKELNQALIQHSNRPKASSCSDPQLFRVLKQYDEKEHVLLEDLQTGEHFYFRNRLFLKGLKRRSRFECVDQSNGKTYLINGQASIQYS